MTLATDGRTFRVTHSSDEYLLLKEPASFPAGSAEFILSIDGVEERILFEVKELVDGRRVDAVSEVLKVAE